MNHNVYHIEKQTFHFGGYWLLTGTLFFLYLPTSQFEMQNAYHALSKGLIPDPATFLPVWFIFGIFGLCCYLCYESFSHRRKRSDFIPCYQISDTSAQATGLL